MHGAIAKQAYPSYLGLSYTILKRSMSIVSNLYKVLSLIPLKEMGAKAKSRYLSGAKANACYAKRPDEYEAV